MQCVCKSRRGFLTFAVMLTASIALVALASVMVYSFKHAIPAYRRKVTQERLNKIADALVSYATTGMGDYDLHVRNRFPDTLNDLVDKGFLNKQDLYDGYGHPFHYYVKNNPKEEGGCLVDMVAEGYVPVALILSYGPNGKLDSDTSSFVVKPDDVGTVVDLSAVAADELNRLRVKLETWAQAASNYWLMNWVTKCIQTNNPDERHCCNPEDNATCDGPQYFFPQTLKDLAAIVYGSEDDVDKMKDLVGDMVVYSPTGPQTFEFSTDCPDTTYNFTIPDTAWRYWNSTVSGGS